MGWAKYDEDIREVVEERRMSSKYAYEAVDYNPYVKKGYIINCYGTYKKETRIVKRPH